MPLVTLVAGTTAGGVLAGGAAVLTWLVLDGLEGARSAVVVSIGAMAAAAVATPAFATWLPDRPRQVPAALLMASPWYAALRWGVELGTGLATFVVTPALYALFAFAVGQDEPLAALLICATYGLSRGAVIAWFAIKYTRTAACKPQLPGAGLKGALRIPLLVSIALAGLVTLA